MTRRRAAEQTEPNPSSSNPLTGVERMLREHNKNPTQSPSRDQEHTSVSAGTFSGTVGVFGLKKTMLRRGTRDLELYLVLQFVSPTEPEKVPYKEILIHKKNYLRRTKKT